jgi:hypothetical protein
MIAIRMRRNLVERSAEDFRPPVSKPNASAWNRLGNRLPRFLDLQAGSIWCDLWAELGLAAGN